MHNNSIKKQQDEQFLLTFLMYTGAFLFSIILIILIHELGHFLAFRWKGYQEVSIRITPFFGMTTTRQDFQIEDAVFIILGGTVFNLSMASVLATILRKVKSPYWAPLKIYSSMAFLIEGMVIIAGLFFDQTITDFAMLNEIGWSQIWIGLLGTIFILIGGYLSYKIWILYGIHRENSIKKLLWMNSQYVIYFLAGFLISQSLLPEELSSIKELLAICMVLHWLFLAIRILLAPRILSRLEMGKIRPVPEITHYSSTFNLILGVVSWAASFLVLN